jgi:hypothetical protein
MSDFIDDDIIEKEISEDEISEDETSITKSETESETSENITDMEETPDEETPEEQLTEPPSESQLLEIQRKEYITKIKVIALDSLGKDPLTNGSTLLSSEKARVISKMEEFMTLDESEITRIFNNICAEKIFSVDRDYSEFPVYNNI